MPTVGKVGRPCAVRRCRLHMEVVGCVLQMSVASVCCMLHPSVACCLCLLHVAVVVCCYDCDDAAALPRSKNATAPACADSTVQQRWAATLQQPACCCTAVPAQMWPPRPEQVRVDIAYGGMWYAIVDAASVGAARCRREYCVSTVNSSSAAVAGSSTR